MMLLEWHHVFAKAATFWRAPVLVGGRLPFLFSVMSQMNPTYDLVLGSIQEAPSADAAASLLPPRIER